MQGALLTVKRTLTVGNHWVARLSAQSLMIGFVGCSVHDHHKARSEKLHIVSFIILVFNITNINGSLLMYFCIYSQVKSPRLYLASSSDRSKLSSVTAEISLSIFAAGHGRPKVTLLSIVVFLILVILPSHRI